MDWRCMVRRGAGAEADGSRPGVASCGRTASAAAAPTPAPRLRRARSTRISIDGNADFCRGLLRTRYPEAATDQIERAEGAEPSDHRAAPVFVPLSQLKEHQAGAP